ncbi:MAG: hypothetical protein GY791_18720 [Alphaproteobacteria bacterium]|nr:hypothetical protein [Alphaproteobacteria bacterium]
MFTTPAIVSDRLYSRHLETIIALVSYLAITSSKSRTAVLMANDLGLEAGEVKTVVETFKALFREAPDPQGGPPYYTLHLRYAMRSQDGKDVEGEAEKSREPISDAKLDSLLRFVVHKSEQETALVVARRSQWISVTCAVIAAMAALVATVG